MHCRACGFVASFGSRFCQQCGQALTQVSTMTATGDAVPGDAVPEPVDETFAGILSRWRQQFAEFQRALGEASSPSEVVETWPLEDENPEAFVQRIKRELGIESGPLGSFEEGLELGSGPGEEVPLSSAEVLRQIQAMSRSFEAEAPAAGARLEKEAKAALGPEAKPDDGKIATDVVEFAPAEPQPPRDDIIAGVGSNDEALLGRLLALEAEVLRLQGERFPQPVESPGGRQPEMSESPRRPSPHGEGEQRPTELPMSSLGLSLLSNSSLFASVSDPGLSEGGRDSPSKASKEEAGKTAEKQEVELEAESRRLGAEGQTDEGALQNSTGLAVFVPFVTSKRDSAVQVPDGELGQDITQASEVPVEPKEGGLAVELELPEAKPAAVGTEAAAGTEAQAEEASGDRPPEANGDRPNGASVQPAEPVISPGPVEPEPSAMPVVEASTENAVQAGSGPLPSKTAGPPEASASGPRTPLSPPRLQAQWPDGPRGLSGPLRKSPSAAHRWPELRPSAPPPPPPMRSARENVYPLDGYANENPHFNGCGILAPPAWNSAGWRPNDGEDLMLQRAYEVYRQQQLDLLRD